LINPENILLNKGKFKLSTSFAPMKSKDLLDLKNNPHSNRKSLNYLAPEIL
jgi:hypothetical protein